MPRMRIPLWAAVAIPAAAYAIRSLARGSIAPDLPADAVVLASLAVVLVLASRYASAAHHGGGDLPGQVDEGDDTERSER